MPSVLVLVLVLSEAVLVIDRGIKHRKGFGVTIKFDDHSRSPSQVVGRVGSDYEHEHRRRATEHEYEYEHEGSFNRTEHSNSRGLRKLPGS